MKLVVVCALIAGCGGSAKPDPAVEPTTARQPGDSPYVVQAAGFNDEGVKAMYAGNYALASEQFRQAVARVPEPKYFFNLCTSLFQEGKFADANVACDAVDKTSPPPALAEKAHKLLARIEDEAKKQGISLQPQGGSLPETPPDPTLTPSPPGGQAAIASNLNDEGVKLMFDGKYSEASMKFREAVARVPEPKYFFNLCTALYQEGKFSEGMTACNAAKKNNPDAKLSAKVDKMIERIQTEAKAQGIQVQP